MKSKLQKYYLTQFVMENDHSDLIPMQEETKTVVQDFCPPLGLKNMPNSIRGTSVGNVLKGRRSESPGNHATLRTSAQVTPYVPPVANTTVSKSQGSRISGHAIDPGMKDITKIKKEIEDTGLPEHEEKSKASILHPSPVVVCQSSKISPKHPKTISATSVPTTTQRKSTSSWFSPLVTFRPKLTDKLTWVYKNFFATYGVI
ncbi:unnamed protein product [Orchesella dallaii]|uniref:Uncharacterized protein n=1 Tax=Orchesella dallaii TaxID=48710 RepID=A0ABP1S1I7_9HEXA